MIKQLLIVLVLVQMSGQAFSICVDGLDNKPLCTVISPVVLPAEEARNTIMTTIYLKHRVTIDWWVEMINAKVLKESRNQSASTLIDVSSASQEVQSYLVLEYERVGYHSELMRDYRDKLFRNPPESSRMYLGLSW